MLNAGNSDRAENTLGSMLKECVGTRKCRIFSDNPYTADNQQERFLLVIKTFIMNNQSWLKSIDSNLGNYISGFVDGEGSFNVSLKKRNDYKNSWKVAASFNVSQNERFILTQIKNALKCGTLRERKDGVIYYEVTNINSLCENIIPFFQKFKFRSIKKQKNFELFSKIVHLIKKGEHLNEKGFKEIVLIREKLNEGIGRKRKYSLQDVENIK